MYLLTEVDVFLSHPANVTLIIILSLSIVGQNLPPGMAHPKRSQTTTAENSVKEEGGVQLRKPSIPGTRGAPPSSPLLGNANNPNKADIPDRRKGATTAPSVSVSAVGLKVKLDCLLCFCMRVLGRGS